MPKNPNPEKIINEFVDKLDAIIRRSSRGIVEITLKIGDKKKPHTPYPDHKKCPESKTKSNHSTSYV